jgi:hypothetical protein
VSGLRIGIPQQFRWLVGIVKTVLVLNHYGRGPYRRWGVASFETHVNQYDEGTLVIDIVDAEAGKLVWRGSGSRRISTSPTPQKTTRRINEAVEAILARFPPH